MHLTHIISVAACLALVQAMPTLKLKRDSVDVTFNGAADASYTISVLLDGGPTLTNNDLSISSISSSYDIGQFCTIDHIDDVPTALVEGPPGTWVVGPPQTIISITCTSGSTPPPLATVEIEFVGAADANYSLTVPLDGSVIPTDNVLSVSTIVTTYANLPSCNLVHVDNVDTRLVQIGDNTWAVGPPQTIESIQCFP